MLDPWAVSGRVRGCFGSIANFEPGLSQALTKPVAGRSQGRW
jgi:hypothetical protein